MNTLTKAMVGTVAAGAMAVSTAAPAYARDNNDGVAAGAVIAGALIIGGIAAIAASSGNNDSDRYDYRYDRAGYGVRGRANPRQAVSQCVRAAESNASRYVRGRANVTNIRSVKNKRNGFDIKGQIAVDTNRGYARRGYDTGRFTCKVRYGRIAKLDYSGIRGLR